MPFPFEVGFGEVEANLDVHVDTVFGSLEYDFLTMPKGKGFIEFAVFDEACEALKGGTGGFREVTPPRILAVVSERPVALIVLRCVLGVTPSEWADCATRNSGFAISQRAARSIDRHTSNAPEHVAGQ